MYNIRKIAVLLLLWPMVSFAQERAVPDTDVKDLLSLDTILKRIDRNNLLLQSYGLRAEGYKYTAKAATAWMAPMVGVGTFMTPYPGQEVMEDRDKG